MNSIPGTCDETKLVLLLEGELSSQEQRDVEEHLSNCSSCQRAIERSASDAEGWQDAKKFLSPVDDETILAPLTTESDLSVYRRMLGPTDDPRMMGRVGSYEVVGLLGRGGMGVVFKAFDATLNRYVAIKMLSPIFSGSAVGKQRFLREAQSAAAVVHEHVVPIHAISTWQDSPYLVMSYVRGESLQKRLSIRGLLSLRELLRIGMQTASGLAAAHAQGLIHRDIKPGNILLETDVDRVLITDFGLARAVDDIRLTRTDTLAGSPAYMSPEQVRDEQLDFRSDLFSLGIVLYEAGTGRSPFRAATSYGATRKITDFSPAPPSRINPDLPAWFDQIVMRLLQKEPSSRYQSAEEVAGLLRQCLAHIEQPHLTTLPLSLGNNKTRSITSPFTRRILMAATLTTALLATAWFAYAPFFTDNTPQTESAESASEQKEPVKEVNGSVAEAGGYKLSVRHIQSLDGMPMVAEFDMSRMPMMMSGQSITNGTATAFSAGGGGGTTGVYMMPNTGIAIDVQAMERKPNMIVEIAQQAKALDNLERVIEHKAISPVKLHFAEFEMQNPDLQPVYLHLPDDKADSLIKLQGELRITSGKVYEVDFEPKENVTKKEDGEKFILKSITDKDDSIEISVVFPSTTAMSKAKSPQEKMQASMAANMGTYSVTLEDNAGETHYSTGGGSGSTGGGEVSTFVMTGQNSSFVQTQKGVSSSPDRSFTFKALPEDRTIKTIRLKMVDRTGETQVVPFTITDIQLKQSEEI